MTPIFSFFTRGTAAAPPQSPHHSLCIPRALNTVLTLVTYFTAKELETTSFAILQFMPTTRSCNGINITHNCAK